MARGVSIRNLLSLGAAVLLAACGGSSSKDDPPPPPPPVVRPPTTVGYTGATTAAPVTTAKSGTLLTSAFGGAKGLASSTGAMTGGVASGAPRFGIIEAKQVLAAKRAQLGAVPAGVLTTDSYACTDGGTVTMSEEDLDGDLSTTDVGDYYDIVFDGCSEFGTTMYGGLYQEVTGTDGAPFLDGDYSTYTDLQWYETAMFFDSFYIVDDVTGDWFGMAGDISFSETIDQTLGEYVSWVYGASIEMAEGNADDVWEAYSMTPATGQLEYAEGYLEAWDPVTWTMTETGFSFTGTECSLSMGGCVEITTPIDFFQFTTDVYPYQGQMTLNVDTGEMLDLLVIDETGNVEVSFDLADGSGVQGPFATTWTCLESVDSSACFLP